MAQGGGGGGSESFEARVKRLFGSSLGGAGAGGGWSVASGEVERVEWNRPSLFEDEQVEPDRADAPCSSAFYDANGCLAKRRKRRNDFADEDDDLDGDDDGAGGDGSPGKEEHDGDDEESLVRRGVGLDSTLDREEEEDRYDREALGNVKIGDRVYMTDIDQGNKMSKHTVAWDSLNDSDEEVYRVCRDPRADHSAANVRLQEDDLAAKAGASAFQVQLPYGRPLKVAEDDVDVKPILKRKEALDDTKPKKRVRFDAEHKADQLQVPSDHSNSHMFPQFMDSAGGEVHSMAVECSSVPDYIRNPSKYTQYTLDGPDCTAESNMKALDNLHGLLNSSNTLHMQSDTLTEPPLSVTFTPRRKTADSMAVDDFSNASTASSCYVGMAADDMLMSSCEREGADGAEELDAKDGKRRAVRQYRTGSKGSDDDVPV